MAGLPALSITGGKNVNKLPIGIQVIGKPFDEVSVLAAGKLIEDCRKMSYFIEGKTGKWEIVMGLEVHAQIKSKSKLFSNASTDWGGEPNSQVELVDSGMPGALPVINEYCVDQAIKTGLSLNAQINLKSIFDRKNYFYPDLPQGYQISQFEFPIVGKGSLSIETDEGLKKLV